MSSRGKRVDRNRVIGLGIAVGREELHDSKVAVAYLKLQLQFCCFQLMMVTQLYKYSP